MKRGILVIGNVIVDYLKTIDAYPEEGHLATILSMAQDVGGNVCNVLFNLSAIDNCIPLSSAGFVGDDSNGAFVVSKLREHNIATDLIDCMAGGNTSFTDVVIPQKGTQQRTFFLYPGVGEELSLDFIRSIQTTSKIIQIGYLGALPKLEIMRDRRQSYFSDALQHFADQGCITAIDLVSGPIDSNLRKVFFSCLPQLSFLIVNEIEVGKLLGVDVRNATGAILTKILQSAAARFLESGVTAVVIHCPEGAFYWDKDGLFLHIPSFFLEAKHVQSTVGAGDAFTAGFLYGVHEEYSPSLSLKLGHAAARFNLNEVSSTGGARSLDELLHFLQTQKTRGDQPK